MRCGADIAEAVIAMLHDEDGMRTSRDRSVGSGCGGGIAHDRRAQIDVGRSRGTTLEGGDTVRQEQRIVKTV